MQVAYGLLTWVVLSVVGAGAFAIASDAPDRFQLLADQITARPGDIVTGSRLRQLCRQDRILDRCIGFFDSLVERHPREANLRYNAALAYVDNVPGHSIVTQARLSTHSIDHATAVLDADPNDWFALYIRGVNNIYWPSWYRRNGRAIADLERCVQMAETGAERKPYHALAYVALGDALIKADREPDAKHVWRRGLAYGAFTDLLKTRLAKGGEELRDFIDAVRSRDVPVDTDISFLHPRDDMPGK